MSDRSGCEAEQREAEITLLDLMEILSNLCLSQVLAVEVLTECDELSVLCAALLLLGIATDSTFPLLGNCFAQFH